MSTNHPNPGLGETDFEHLDVLPGRALAASGAPDRRLDYFAATPKGLAAFRRKQTDLDSYGLEHSLFELVKIRASRIIGCAYCFLMALSAWHEHLSFPSAGGPPAVSFRTPPGSDQHRKPTPASSPTTSIRS